MATLIRLASEQPTLERTAARPPKLTVIEGDATPAPTRKLVWRHTPSGRLIPQTGKWDRITLTRWRVTKAWRAVSAELDAATDALDAAEESDLDAKLNAWLTIAARAVILDAHSAQTMRCRIALAALLSGHRFTFGGLWAADGNPTRTEAAFYALDRAALLCAQHAEAVSDQERAKRCRTRARTARKAQDGRDAPPQGD
jgi:hypothetical protein